MSRERMSEFIRFICAGVVCFFVELVVFVLLKEKLRLDTLVATPIAFTVSVIVNYLMCVFWVFKGARQQSRKNQIAFLLTSVIGLVLNELLMLFFRVVWGEDLVLLTVFSYTVNLYVLNKVLSTGVVIIWNYFTKRYFLTRK